jgi:hypothetical protein
MWSAQYGFSPAFLDSRKNDSQLVQNSVPQLSLKQNNPGLLTASIGVLHILQISWFEPELMMISPVVGPMAL